MRDKLITELCYRLQNTLSISKTQLYTKGMSLKLWTNYQYTQWKKSSWTAVPITHKYNIHPLVKMYDSRNIKSHVSRNSTPSNGLEYRMLGNRERTTHRLFPLSLKHTKRKWNSCIYKMLKFLLVIQISISTNNEVFINDYSNNLEIHHAPACCECPIPAT